MAKFPIANNPSDGRPEAQFQQFGYNDQSFSSAEAEALRLVKFEKTNWETAYAYVTEKVAFNMRDIIRQCRKNYWGVFDQQTDPTTGRQKLWEHLTKTFVDYVVTAYNIDTKDLNFRAKHPDAYGLTAIVRSIVKNKFDEIGFGEKLKLALRQLAIDGTIVWTIDETDKEPKLRLVDLLNFYIDPTVDSIAEADSVIERIVVPISEFERLAAAGNWKNKDIKGRQNVSRYDTYNSPGYNTNTDINYVELYRRRGLAKKLVLTGNPDDQELVPTEIICSGTAGNWLFHYAEARKDNKNKGYEEAWLIKTHGRWYGEGVAERLVQKQLHINIVTNIKINRAYVSQLGIILTRRGSGITPQMVSKLAANGVLSVTDVNNDIKQFPIESDADVADREIENIYNWSQRYTGAENTISGEPLPASTPATNAAIQNQGSISRFSLIKDGIGLFLQRWLKNQALPAIFRTVQIGDLIRMHLDPTDLEDLDKIIVNNALAKKLQAAKENDIILNPEDILMEQQRGLAKLQAYGEQRFVKLLHDIDITQFDVEPYVTNEELNKAVLLQNLQQLTQTMAAIPGMDPHGIVDIIRQEVDLMGLDASRIKVSAQPQQQPGMNQQSMMNGQASITQPGGNPPNLGPAQTPGQVTAPAMTMEPR